MFAYCSNNPVMGYDPSGEGWLEWLIGAAVVVACAVVVTAGSAAAGVAAVAAVVNGTAAATTASTVAAGAFIGSSLTYATAVTSAAVSSKSVDEFAEKGNWDTVAETVIGGVVGGYVGYRIDKSVNNNLKNISTADSQKGQYTEPKNLKEQLSMESAKSNPSAGKVIINELNDSRWPAGSVKMQQSFAYHDILGFDDGCTIHYIMTPGGRAYDFKFVR